MRILIDMDGIVTDLLAKWLRVYNADYGDNVTKADIKSFNVHRHLSTCLAEGVYSYLNRPGFFADLDPIPGAIDAIRSLQKDGHDVRIATSAANPDSARAKLQWLGRHLDMTRKDVFICHDKHWIDADALIDDKPDNLKLWIASGRCAMTIAYPYNTCCRNIVDCYAEGYDDTERAWETILEALR